MTFITVVMMETESQGQSMKLGSNLGLEPMIVVCLVHAQLQRHLTHLPTDCINTHIYFILSSSNRLSVRKGGERVVNCTALLSHSLLDSSSFTVQPVLLPFVVEWECLTMVVGCFFWKRLLISIGAPLLA